MGLLYKKSLDLLVANTNVRNTELLSLSCSNGGQEATEGLLTVLHLL